MSRFWVIVWGVVAAATLAVPAGARVQSASGDTCTVSGSGTQYTLRIATPGGGQQQYGFALRASGGTITSVAIPGANGNFSTSVSVLAPNTGAGWFGDAALPASAIATITTSGALRSLTVVPSLTASTASAAQSFAAPVTCSMNAAAPVRTTSLTVSPHATYSSAARAWHVVVTVPGAGIVSAVQLVPTIGTAYSKAETAKTLVQVHRVTTKAAGSVTLTLKATSKGQGALKASGRFKVPLRVTFDANSGKSAQKNVTLTLSA